MFCFGGRRANIELQLPFIDRILEQNPEVRYDLWNLARNADDDDYLRSLDGRHPRFTVLNTFAGGTPWGHFDDVYRHYAQEPYEGCMFVKLDDDVVFIETDRFAEFVDIAEAHPGIITSAAVINNGACTKMWPGLWKEFRKLNVRLLDVHLHPRYAFVSHRWFLDTRPVAVADELRVRNTDDWLSINFIAYDYEMAKEIARLLKTPSPRRIAGRLFKPTAKLGDEGLVNTLPRQIAFGMTVAHLTFGPQERKARPAQWDEIRARYAEFNKEYLS